MMMQTSRPLNFKSNKQGAICFLEYKGDFLLMKRSMRSHQGGSWTAAPGGKLEDGESPLNCAVREIREETGIEILPKKIVFIHSVYYQFDDIEYTLHLFYSRLDQLPEVTLAENEHTEFRWAPLKSALELPLMRGGHECINLVQKWLLSKTN
jgi:8-oxo-dGTP pyrophosphatase MutT (NUDIX family)